MNNCIPTTKRIHFRTLEEAALAAQACSQHFSHPAKAYLGLLELMINAVEHGNLGIDRETKERLLRESCWEDEIVKRLSSPDFQPREAIAEIVPDGNGGVCVRIADAGNGFDWKPYLAHDPMSAYDAPNGRGILLARHSGLGLEYLEPGNTVICRDLTAHEASNRNFGGV